MCARVCRDLVVNYWFLGLWVTSDWKSNVGTTVPTFYHEIRVQSDKLYKLSPVGFRALIVTS